MRKIKNQKGQAVIENVLITVLVFGLAYFVLNYMKDNEWMNSIIEAPKEYVQGMARSGVWVRVRGDNDLQFHPNNIDRHIMSRGSNID